jgi:hypothetical protein
MARPVTFPVTGSASANADELNDMQDGLRSIRVVSGSQGSPITGSPAAIVADFNPSGSAQLHGLVLEAFVGSDAAVALTTANVASGEESWISLVFRQVGGPWDLTFIRSPLDTWEIRTEGNVALTPSTTGDTIDLFDLWTPNGTDWFGSVSKAWA